MAKGLREAHEKGQKHAERFRELSATFPPVTIGRWTTALDRWTKDPTSKPDPFEELETRMLISLCHE